MTSRSLTVAALGFALFFSVASLLGQGQAGRVEWVMPGTPSSPWADVKLGMPGQSANNTESRVEWVMPGRETLSEYTMPGQESRDERGMPGQESIDVNAAPGSASGESMAASDPGALDVAIAPYALCSDPLLAIVLAASTAPAEVVFAARWSRDNPNPASIDGQRLDGSVKALARFPDVLAAMDRDITGTQAIGLEVLAGPAPILDSVQRLRRSAMGLGNLVPGTTQRLVSVGADLQILPADARLLHTPYYDPYQAFDGQIQLEWDAGIPMGGWAHYGIDWQRRQIVDTASGAAWAHDPVGGNVPDAGGGEGYAPRAEVERWQERGRQSDGRESGDMIGYEEGVSTERASARGRASSASSTN